MNVFLLLIRSSLLPLVLLISPLPSFVELRNVNGPVGIACLHVQEHPTRKRIKMKSKEREETDHISTVHLSSLSPINWTPHQAANTANPKAKGKQCNRGEQEGRR